MWVARSTFHWYRRDSGLQSTNLSIRKRNSVMSDTSPKDKTQQQIRHLRELIVALDKRQPRIERVGETEIAHDAAALKKKALQRLAELQADVEQ